MLKIGIVNISILICEALCILIFPAQISAQVLINEVSPVSSPEWIEIYNIGSNTISLKEYSINFGSDSQNLIFCDNEQIEANEYKIIELSSSWLANTGDVVILKEGDDEADKIGYGTGYILPKTDTILKYLTRSPDGSSNWILNSQSSRQGSLISFNCPSPTPTASPTISPTDPPEQEVFKASYKINSPKDGNGALITSVQIYVDGNYIHHEDEENLYFFNGHECYTGVDCSLGNHTISLRKNGYESWEDTQNFSAGSNIEVSPILTKIQILTPSPLVTPTLSPKQTVYKTSTPSAEYISSNSGEINNSFVLGVGSELSPKPEGVNHKKFDKKLILPILIIFTGIGFIGYSISSIIRNVKRKDTEIY